VLQNKVGVQKLFKLFGHFSLIYICLFYSLYATSFEEFKSTQNNSFKKYRSKNDLVFSSYLKAQWQEYTKREAFSLYQEEKPKSIRATVAKKVKKLGPRVNIKVSIKNPIQNIPQTNILNKNKDIYMNYFGQKLGFNIDKNIKDIQFYPQNQNGIANFFDAMALSNYEITIEEIKDVSKKLHLNDWGVYELVNQLSKTLYYSPDTVKLFSWFFLNKLGYEVKIGLIQKHVILMHYSKKIIYAVPSYKINNKKFYVLSHYEKSSLGRIYTYKKDYPNAKKALDLSLEELPKFQKNLKTKTLSFKEFGKVYTVSFSYDKNLIDFMATYPQADYETYFNAPISSDTYEQIAQDMKKYVNNRHSSYAINFVLNFVQKAFMYERDQEQFGKEKVMFAYETLYYDKSDCEDRAILFAYLVKKLFGISVVGVKYKDHMATALYIPMKGDSVKVNGKRFIIADPSYINANIGQSMPKYKSIIPQDFIYLREPQS